MILTPKVRQIIAVASAGLLVTMMMATWGYPAAFLPQVEGEDSDIHLSKEQSSWFATVTLMMCIPGSVIGATAYEWFGPRKAMLTLMPVLGASVAMMALASLKIVQDNGIAEILLLTTRVVQGSAVAFLNPFVTVFTYEMCDQRIRGVMTSAVDTWACIGYLLSYVAGCFLSWDTIAWLMPLVVLLPSFIGMQMSPESPFWLARKGREDEAKEAFLKIRNSTKEVEEELKFIKSSMKKNGSTSFSHQVHTLMKKSNIKAIIASCLIVSINQITGFSVIAIYIVHIFEAAGIGLDPGLSSVVVGSSRIIFSAIACLMLHKVSRRPMLNVGNSLTGLSSLTLGLFFYFQSTGYDVSWYYWLPLLCLVIWMVGYSSTVGPTTWIVSVELLPGPVRSIGFGIATTCYAATAFLLSKFFVNIQSEIGMHGVFFIFAAGSFSYLLVTFLYIPETYGMSMQDIQDYWDNSKLEKNRPTAIRV